MPEPASAVLTPWSNFYVITGSSAAALTGLMFVVITLVAGEERIRKAPDGIGTFSSPTVVHFCAALLVSAILTAPWQLLVHPATLLTIVGVVGISYGINIMYRLRVKNSNYLPDLDDWVWYAIFPIVAYGAIAVSALMLVAHPIHALFGIGAANIFLIFIGIRNSWDVVTFIALT